MTSGIFDYIEDAPFKESIENNPSQTFTPVQLIDIAGESANKDYFPPGKGWHYSNTNYIIAGLIIENVTGKTVEQNLESRILGATHLNLLNTYYSDVYPTDIVSQTVDGYGKFNGEIKDFTSNNLTWAGSAAGMLSNTGDMVRWIRSLFNCGVIQSNQLAEMKSLVCDSDSPTVCMAGQPTTMQVGGYGLGLIESYVQPYGEIWSYKGETLGYIFNYYWIPSYSTVISVTGNSTSVSHDYTSTLASQILTLLYNSCEWRRYRKTF